MLRILQTADVHLGARYPLLGERASDQRERQFAAFERTVELAIASPVDLVIIAGDLFDSSVEPRRSVERVAAALKSLGVAGIRTVLIPGDHDAPGRASLYHAYDLAALAGGIAGGDALTVLAVDGPDLDIPALGVRVTARFPAPDLRDDGWRIGVVHAAERPRDDEIAGAGVDYLAIGGPHSAASGRAGTVSWGVSGVPELVDLERDGSGEVLLVTLDEAVAHPTIERRPVGRTRFEQLDVAVSAVEDQVALVALLAAKADPDLVLDVRLRGPWRDELELDPDALEATLAARFLRVRVRNEATPPLTTGPLPPPDTIAGAFIRDLEARLTELEAAGEREPAGELREALRLGRRLLVGREPER